MDLMCSIVERWAAGAKLSSDDIVAAIGEAPEAAARRQAEAQSMGGDNVAVVPVYGVLAHRAYSVQNTSKPLTSTEALSHAFRSAAATPGVDTIVMDVDSPGGSVFGVQELAETLKAIKDGGTRVVAVANNTAASGGYWIASQAHELIVTPSGVVGAIGVIVPHTDASAAYEKAGIKRQFITYGRFKAEGNETEPLSEETRAHIQAMVNNYGAEFTRAVARGRNTSVDVVRGPAFGEGRMKTASEAIQSGMADRIGTLEKVVAEYRRKPSARRGMSASMADRDIQIAEA
jgi:signal peptide peptidase SppA